jgi:alpha-galactosidase
MGLSPANDAEYKQFRGLVEQWRKVAEYFYGDFYPLTPYHTETSEWMAWQFDRPDQADGMVQAFRRPDSSFETARFKLRGLDAAARYRVTDVDSGSPAELSGRDLMETGLQVTIAKRPGAAVLTYQRAGR